MPYRIIKTVDGRRGSFLVLAGGMFLPVSTSYLFLDTVDRTAVLSWLPEWIRLWQFGVIFTVASVAGIVIGLLSKRLSPRIVGYGFAAVMIPPTTAGALFLLAALFGITPAGWITAFYYFSLSAMIYLASAWPNPTTTPPATAPTSIPKDGGR